jgi:HSP20 family molecular chaperone IbpA
MSSMTQPSQQSAQPLAKCGAQAERRDPFADAAMQAFGGGDALMDPFLSAFGTLAPFGGLGALAPLMRESMARAQAAIPRLSLDVHEDAAGLAIAADVAGARKEDINLTVDGQNIFLCVCRPEAVSTQDDASKRVWRQERASGSASRTLFVGTGYDLTKLAVEGLVDGVLRIRVPRAAGAPARRRIAL